MINQQSLDSIKIEDGEKVIDRSQLIIAKLYQYWRMGSSTRKVLPTSEVVLSMIIKVFWRLIFFNFHECLRIHDMHHWRFFLHFSKIFHSIRQFFSFLSHVLSWIFWKLSEDSFIFQNIFNKRIQNGRCFESRKVFSNQEGSWRFPADFFQFNHFHSLSTV